MYHRYMPTENGQYQRKTVPEAQKASPQSRNSEETPCPPRKTAQQEAPRAPKQMPSSPPISGGGFLQRLLPNMDSGDLLVLLILIFLLSEGNEDSTSVIMTLAIFLFLQ